MIFFLPKCDYLLTVSHGGEGLDFWLSEQVVKTESSLLPKNRTSIIYHTITPTQQDSCGYYKVRPSILQVWNSDFQNRSSRRNPAFSLYNWTSRIYHTTTPSQQIPCGYDKVGTMIIQCTYDTEYCWRSTGLTGPSQASSIHLLITASIVLLDQDFRRHPLCIARTSRRFVDTFRLRKISRKAAHLVKPNAESVV